MSKDSVVSNEAKLTMLSNFYFWKYMITRIAKKEKLWSILFDPITTTSSKKSKESKESELDDE